MLRLLSKARKDDWMKHNERLEQLRQQLIKKQPQEAMKQQQEAMKQQQEAAKQQVTPLKAPTKAKAKNEAIGMKAERKMKEQQEELGQQEAYHVPFETISDKIRDDKSVCDLESRQRYETRSRR